jgi:ABC-type nitrate/sulfonate/bicarbonate transport system ATPase subunit
MYHYDPKLALEELQEEALLPHPVKLRDMILRNKLDPEHARTLNNEFQEYLTEFGKLQKMGRAILQQLSSGQRKSA